MREFLVIAVGILIGCGGAEPLGTPRSVPDPGDDLCDARSDVCDCPGGTTQGLDACGASCACATPPALHEGFDNSVDAAEVVDAGSPQSVRQSARCEPGLYLGQYQCQLTVFGVPLPLTGDVSFNLAVNEELVEIDNCQEFCADLVIAEGTGTLFGLANFWGFEAELSGGLDCQTGEFRATAPAGIYGSPVSSDPSDPEALWTVADPPLGTFTGSLTGMHETVPEQLVSGEWNLVAQAFGASCVGPFTVVLQR